MSGLAISVLPVLAAPMAGGPSTPRSVAAAAAAESLGFLPAGYRTAEQFSADLDETRRLTGTFGVNLFVPEAHPIDRAAVLAYRDLITPVAERVGVTLGTPRWDDRDDWAAKVDSSSATRSRG